MSQNLAFAAQQPRLRQTAHAHRLVLAQEPEQTDAAFLPLAALLLLADRPSAKNSQAQQPQRRGSAQERPTAAQEAQAKTAAQAFLPSKQQLAATVEGS